MEVTPVLAALLMTSGVIVGFINTLAGGATVISMTVFTMLGLPISVANGTNRVAVILQNLTSSLNFFRHKSLDMKVGLKLTVPTIVGSVAGSQVASTIDEQILRICLGVVLFVMLLFMILSSDKRLKGDGIAPFRVRWIHYLWFLLIGFYSGYIYVGLGYLILAVTISSFRMDIVRANALKGFIVLTSTPFALIVFMLNGQVNYTYGLIHAVGNVAGAFLGSQYGIKWGVGFIRWLMIGVILVLMADMFGFISLTGLIRSAIA